MQRSSGVSTHLSQRDRVHTRLVALAVAAALAVGATAAAVRPAAAEASAAPAAATLPDGPYQQSPWWEYLSGHIDDQAPRDVAGGPIAISASQPTGAVNWILPGPRALDPAIFGTPDDPKGTELPALVLGVPEKLRTVQDGTYMTSVPTPFSDKAAQVEGDVQLTVVDATATDGATTKDQIDFKATFTGPDGAHYEIAVDRPAAHGWFNPTGGGVVTNFIQHGVTGWGTRLMPTEYDDLAFWGLGTVSRDGAVIAEDRPVHVMLTEFVRGEGYRLVQDAGVDPRARHLHVMVAPVDPFGNQDPVPTGFMLPNGQEQPFLHIMYPGVEITDAGALAQDGIAAAGQTSATDQADQAACVAASIVDNVSYRGTAEATGQVAMQAGDQYFSPTCVKVGSGDAIEVTVTNTGQALHSITVPSQGIDVDIAPGEVATVTVAIGDDPVPFVCKYHSGLGMVGAFLPAQ